MKSDLFLCCSASHIQIDLPDTPSGKPQLVWLAEAYFLNVLFLLLAALICDEAYVVGLAGLSAWVEAVGWEGTAALDCEMNHKNPKDKVACNL
jgi:hypothetical protein